VGDAAPHQRRVLIGLAFNGVPIEVLAERLGTTRGALYNTLHDARRKHLRSRGMQVESSFMETRSWKDLI
jgi:RNA polymerase sigma-70 factor (ECF subfamily)